MDKRIRTKSAFREMFKYKNHITHTLEKLVAIESKRRIVEVISLCDGVIEIPQLGTKHSFNIAVSCGMVLWEYARTRV